MLKIKSGFLFILFLSCRSLCPAEDKDTVYDRIVVIKNKEALPGDYSLDSDTLASLPFASPVEALNVSLLNLQARSPNDAIQADFSLRGSNFQGVRVLVNGQRINDPQTGHHNADIPLTKEDILDIGITSGISPSGLGPDAIGGSVNFVTKRPKEKKFVLEASGGEYSSFGELLSISDKIKGLGLRFSVENKESKGFHEDTDFKKFTANMASSLDLPLGSFDLDFGVQDKEFGAYDFYTPGSGLPSKEWTKTYLLNTGANLDKDGLIIKPNFLWRRHYDKFMLDKTRPSYYLAHHRTDIYTPGIYLSKEGTFLGRLGLGVEYSHEGISSTTLGDHKRQRESIFIDNAYSFTERLSLDSSLRVDNYNSRDTPVSGRVGLAYSLLNNSTIHIGAVRATRIPSFTELYYNDPKTIGNPGLSSEKSFAYEGGYSFSQGGFSLSSVIFLRDEDNFIDWVKATPDQGKWEAKNIASSRVFGIEEKLRFALNGRLDLTANYAYTDRRKDDNGYIYKYGENYARHLAGLISVFKLDFGVQEAGLTYKKSPGRSGWFLMHAKISYNLNKRARFFISATNIFNVEYQEIAGIPSPGRWVEGGLRVEW